MYPFIDEDHVSLVLTSTVDFQSTSSGHDPEGNNKHNSSLTHQYNPSLLTCTNRILTPPTKHLLGKSQPLWMWIRPYRISTPTLLHKIFPSSYYIPTIRPRNRTTTTPPVSISRKQLNNHPYHGTRINLPASRKFSLRVNRKRTWMNRIW